MVGEETKKGLENQFNFYELDKIAVKGKSEGVRIYTVLDNAKYYPNHLAFLDSYINKEWDEAIKHAKFNKRGISELVGYYDMMISRIKELKNTNTDDWDAIYRSTSK